MAVKVKELHHTALRFPPEKANEVLGFYADVFGMSKDPIRDRIPTPVPGAWLNVGEEGRSTTQIHLMGIEPVFPDAEEAPNAGRPHIALAVDDLDEAKAELDRLGVPWSQAGVPGLGLVQVIVADPAGNVYEIHDIHACDCVKLPR